jgi:hypothetical protein
LQDKFCGCYNYVKGENMEKFKAWLAAASFNERLELALLAETNTQMFYKLQYRKEVGGRVASAEFAARLEKGIAYLNSKNPKLPEVTRADISPSCARCPCYKRAGEDSV